MYDSVIKCHNTQDNMSAVPSMYWNLNDNVPGNVFNVHTDVSIDTKLFTCEIHTYDIKRFFRNVSHPSHRPKCRKGWSPLIMGIPCPRRRLLGASRLSTRDKALDVFRCQSKPPLYPSSPLVVKDPRPVKTPPVPWLPLFGLAFLPRPFYTTATSNA